MGLLSAMLERHKVDLSKLTLDWLRTPEGLEWLENQLRLCYGPYWNRAEETVAVESFQNVLAALLRLLLAMPEPQEPDWEYRVAWQCKVGPRKDDWMFDSMNCQADRLSDPVLLANEFRNRIEGLPTRRDVRIERRTAPGPWERVKEKDAQS